MPVAVLSKLIDAPKYLHTLQIAPPKYQVYMILILYGKFRNIENAEFKHVRQSRARPCPRLQRRRALLRVANTHSGEMTC